MKKIVYALFAIFAICACQPRQPRLVILHTNDTHSHYEAVRSGEYAGQGGVIERAAFVDSVRSRYGDDKVLLLHAGDFSQGTSYFSELKGQFEPKIINDLKYDCIALGNHEFDNGIEALTQRIAQLKYTKVVCANVDLSPFELGKYVKPYAVISRAGMKIGIIGLEADLSTDVSKTISSRLQQLDNVEVTNKWSEYLHNVEKCDFIILLSHLGYDKDEALVPHTKFLNIVVGGHTHKFVDDFLYVKDSDQKKVPIITDGMWGLEMGQVDVW